MGQKVNPVGFRVGPTLTKNWNSVFYAEKEYPKLLIEDLRLRKFVMDKCKASQVSNVLIERRSDGSVSIGIFTKKPGMIIGKSGAEIDKLKKSIEERIGKNVSLNITEVKKFSTDASIIAQTIATQLEKRGSFRKAMKTSMQSAMKQGAKGIKVCCSGRLAGAEIARSEWYREGRVPLHTLRADIDYATAEAQTTYGVIGIKVWVYKGIVSTKSSTKN